MTKHELLRKSVDIFNQHWSHIMIQIGYEDYVCMCEQILCELMEEME